MGWVGPVRSASLDLEGYVDYMGVGLKGTETGQEQMDLEGH